MRKLNKHFRFTLKLNSHFSREAFSIGCAVFFATAASFYLHGSVWLILSAFFASYVSRGTPMRQSAYVCIVIVAVLFFVSLITPIIPEPYLLMIAMVLLLVSGYFLFLNPSMSPKSFFNLMLISLLLFLGLMFPADDGIMLRSDMLDVVIGVAIVALSKQLIFPLHFEQEFRRGVTPVLSAVQDYMQEVTQYFLYGGENHLAEKQIKLEKSMQAQYGVYPEWVYDLGFNPGLRSSFRFYLIQMERMVEIVFSMACLTNRGVDFELLKKTADAVFLATQKNAELIAILIDYFNHGTFSDVPADLTQDIAHLETLVRDVTPGQLELLDILPDYLVLMAFVRDIKDLRQLLLQLIVGLPNKEVNR